MQRRFAVLAAAAAALASVASAQDVTVRVYRDGSGDFSSVQAALDAQAPGTNATLGHVTLMLRGFFRERVHVYSNFSRGVSFIADDDAPTISFNTSANGPGNPGTFGSWSCQVEANDFTAVGVTFVNDADDYDHKVAGQSVALDIRGDRAALLAGSVFGSQDSLYTGNGRVYTADLWINGTCDAIFGEGAAVFERATIRMDFTVTAQKGNGSTAYLFLDSDIDSISGPSVLLLGRPWGALAKTVFMGSKLGAGVAALGWDDWSHGCTSAKPGTQTWCNATVYAEYNNTGPGYVPKSRPWWTQQLSAAEAADWTVESVLSGWTPQAPPAAAVAVARRGVFPH